MFDTRLIIVEGVMGSGKSTISKMIAQRLRQHHYKSKLVPESFREHPVSVTRTLTHWHQILVEHTIESFIAQSQQNWQAFVTTALQTPTIAVFDGQFFHGDMTSLFIANASRTQLVQYSNNVAEIIQPLRPVFIYLYQDDIAKGLERTVAIRSKSWLRRQIEWKVDSPYCAERGYRDTTGWIQLYRDFRSLTDELYACLAMPKIAIENGEGKWRDYEAQIFTFLALPDARPASSG
jgi:thymidylate kinase